jgi:hypothetical protein
MDKYRVKICYGEKCAKRTAKILDLSTVNVALFVVIGVEADGKLVVGIPIGKIEGDLEDSIVKTLDVNMNQIVATLTKIEEVEKETYMIRPKQAK